jgi:hypothetical protein
VSTSALAGGLCRRRDRLVPDRGLRLLVRRQIQFGDLVEALSEAELIVLPARNSMNVQPASFEHAGRLIRETLEAARVRLASRTTRRHLRLAS